MPIVYNVAAGNVGSWAPASGAVTLATLTIAPFGVNDYGISQSNNSGPVSSMGATYTLAGLTIGQMYRFSGDMRRNAAANPALPMTALLGVNGIAGASMSTPVPAIGSPLVPMTAYFKATATSHLLVVTVTGSFVTPQAGVDYFHMLVETVPAVAAVTAITADSAAAISAAPFALVDTRVAMHRSAAAVQNTPKAVTAYPEVERYAATRDKTWSPYAQAQLDAVLDTSTALLYDPRDFCRVRFGTARFLMAADGTFYGAQLKSYDLALRERELKLTARRVYLNLGSDEAFLQDRKGQVDVDKLAAYYALSSSWNLRGMVNDVLNTVDGAYNDAVLQTNEVLTNLHPNPRSLTLATGYSATATGGTVSVARQATGGPASPAIPTNTRVTRASGTLTDIRFAVGDTMTGVQIGRGFRAGAYVYSTVACKAYVEMGWGGVFSADDLVQVVTVPAATWTWVEGAGICEPPANTASGSSTRVVRPRLRFIGASWGASAYVAATGIIFSMQDKPLEGFWDGSTSAAGAYTYAWTGTTGNSTSTRTEAITQPNTNLPPMDDAINVVPNPNFRASVGNWIAGGVNGTLVRVAGAPSSPPYAGITAYSRTTWTGNSGLGAGGAWNQAATIAPYAEISDSSTVSVSVWVRSSVAKTVDLKGQVYDANGSLIDGGRSVIGAQGIALVANVWTRLWGEMTVPVRPTTGGSRVSLFVYPDAASQWVSGNTLETVGWMMTSTGDYINPSQRFAKDPLLGLTSVPFDGDTTDTSEYSYSWDEASNASRSTRIALTPRPREGYIWEAEESALEFIAPFVDAAGYRLFCDEHRVWRMVDASTYAVAGSALFTYDGTSGNVVDVNETISRDNENWGEMVVVVWTWRDPSTGNVMRKTEYSGSNLSYGKQTVIQVNAAYPGAGAAAAYLAALARRGREQSVVAEVDLNVQPSQSYRSELAGLTSVDGQVSSVTFDTDAKTMTVVGNDLVDSP